MCLTGRGVPPVLNELNIEIDCRWTTSICRGLKQAGSTSTCRQRGSGSRLPASTPAAEQEEQQRARSGSDSGTSSRATRPPSSPARQEWERRQRQHQRRQQAHEELTRGWRAASYARRASGVGPCSPAGRRAGGQAEACKGSLRILLLTTGASSPQAIACLPSCPLSATCLPAPRPPATTHSALQEKPCSAATCQQALTYCMS